MPSAEFEIDLVQILTCSVDAPIALGQSLYECCKQFLTELKVVEYNGPQTRTVCYSAPGTTIRVQLYTLNSSERVLEDDSKLPQAEIMYLPNIRFSGHWDEYTSLELCFAISR